MDSKRTLSITEARKRIFEIIEDVQKPDTHYTLTEKGRPKAVILSVEEYESLWETIKTLEDTPDLAQKAKDAEKAYERGEYITLEELLAKEGYIFADKGKEKYEVPRRRSKKRTKNH
jgi:antitoxin YefM